MVDIKGYEGLYAVDKMGKVTNLQTGKSLKWYPRGRGYTAVQLWKNRQGKHATIHRLVAQAFIPNPNNYPYVNHKDSDKTNNVWTNLEWCTASQNTQHAINAGIHIVSKTRKLTPEKITQLLTMRRNGYTATAIAKELGVSTGCILLFINGVTYKHLR